MLIHITGHGPHVSGDKVTIQGCTAWVNFGIRAGRALYNIL